METLPAAQAMSPIEAAQRLRDGLHLAAAGRRELEALEEAERKERARAWEERSMREHLFLNAGEGDRRRLERLALQDAAFRSWQEIEGEVDREIEAARERFRAECARIRAAGRERQGEVACAYAKRQEKLMAEHRAAFARELPGLLQRIEKARQKAMQGQDTVRR